MKATLRQIIEMYPEKRVELTEAAKRYTSTTMNKSREQIYNVRNLLLASQGALDAPSIRKGCGPFNGVQHR